MTDRILKELAECKAALAEKEAELAGLREMHRIAWTNEMELTKELSALQEKVREFLGLCGDMFENRKDITNLMISIRAAVEKPAESAKVG